jgi:hypothetical protein
MKKLVLSIVFATMISFGANAQNDWFISDMENQADDWRTGLSIVLVTGSVGQFNNDQPANAPVGSGLLIMTALGVGYALKKKRDASVRR